MAAVSLFGSTEYGCSDVMSHEPSASVSKRVLMQKLSYGNEFDLLEDESLSGTHLYKWFPTKTRFDMHKDKRQLGNGL